MIKSPAKSWDRGGRGGRGGPLKSCDCVMSCVYCKEIHPTNQVFICFLSMAFMAFMCVAGWTMLEHHFLVPETGP